MVTNQTMSSIERRPHRRPRISSLVHTIRMDGVRQANIYPTCRLDKSNRAVYEPEDVSAKRAALARVDSRIKSGARGLLKPKVLVMSTVRVTREDIKAVDRVKETVATLMINKEREADIGTAERRILQPRLAREIDRMSAAKKVEFDARTKAAVERIVYAAKRRYVRRQEKLDKTGVFHPEANAHRVHTQFWADLQQRVNLTEIENVVWAKMSTEAATSRDSEITPKTKSRRTDTVAVANGKSLKSGQPEIHTSRNSRTLPGAYQEQTEVQGDDNHARVHADGISPENSLDKFFGIPGYNEIGHVPTLEQFRLEWPKPTSASMHNLRDPPESTNDRRIRSEGEAHGAENVVQELSKRDKVFRHFKKFYDKVDRHRAMTNPLFPRGSPDNSLLGPDFSVLEAVSRHTAQTEEIRARSRIGKGILSTAVAGSRLRSRQKRLNSSDEEHVRENGLTNVFHEAEEAAGSAESDRVGDALADEPEDRAASLDTPTVDSNCKSETDNGSTDESMEYLGSKSVELKRSTNSRRANRAPESSSVSAKLKVSLEQSWRALDCPVRVKLDFLQKYSTVERALDLPRAAQLLHIASKAAPLRQKAIDLLHRLKDNGEPMCASEVFSVADKACLVDLDCWMDFPDAAKGDNQCRSSLERSNNDQDPCESESRDSNEGQVMDATKDLFVGMGLHIDEAGRTDSVSDRRSEQLREEKAVLVWLESIEPKLTGKCAEACDMAWYELGETLTYQGKSIAADLPPEAMEAAVWRREELRHE